MPNEQRKKNGIEHALINGGGLELFDPRNSYSREKLPSLFSFPQLTPIIDRVYWYSAHREANEPDAVSEFSAAAEPVVQGARPLRRTREVGINFYKTDSGQTYTAPIVTGTNTDLNRLDKQLYNLVDAGKFPLLQAHSHPEEYLGFHSLGDLTVLLLRRSGNTEDGLPLLNASCVLGADAQVLAVMTKESHDLISDDERLDFQQPWRDRFDEAQGDAGEEDQIRVELARHMGAWMYFSTDRANFKAMPPGQIVRRLRALEVARLRGRK